MPKSKRSRKIERLREKVDKMLASMPPPTPWPEPFRSHAEARLRAILTPERVTEMERSLAEMKRIDHVMRSMSASWDRLLGPGRPGVLGSNRTKRLRKKRSNAHALG
jgi:hypothetical protein